MRRFGCASGRSGGVLAAGPRARAATWILACALLPLGGCVTEVTCTINADGSARLQFTATRLEADYWGDINTEMAITRSKRIDGWEGVSFRRDGAGNSTLKATAYVKDINDFHIPGGNHFELKLENRADGTRSLRIRHSRQYDYRPKQAIPEAKVRERIAKVRRDYVAQLQDPENAKNRKTRYTIVIDPPGKVRSAVNLKRRDDGKLEIVYSYAAYQDALGEILKDERAVREFVSAGETILKMGDVLTSMLNERLFGIRAQVQAVLEGPFENKFDYAAAVARAETDHGKIVREAGFLPEALPKAGAAGNLLDVHVKRAQRLKGGAISLVFEAKVPKPGRYNNHCEFYRIVDDQGRVLLPAHGINRVGTQVLRSDGLSVEIQLGLASAPADAKTFKEVSGVCRYRALGPLFAESLGRLVPQKGAKLDKHNFVITDFSRDARRGLLIAWQADAPPNLARVVLLEGRKEFLSYEIEPEAHQRRLFRPFQNFDPNVKTPKSLEVVFYTTSKVELIEAPFVLENVPITE